MPILFQGKLFNVTVIQVYAPTSMVLWRPIRPSRTNMPKICPFHYMGLECKSSKSRDTWSNKQIWPWSTKWSRSNANRVLPRECTGHSKHPFQQHKRRLLWSIPKSDWLYSLQPKMEKLYTVSQNKTGNWLWLRSWTYCQIQTEMGEFNSDDHYVYYCGPQSLRRKGIAFIVNKCLKRSTWVQSQKWQNNLGPFPR